MRPRRGAGIFCRFSSLDGTIGEANVVVVERMLTAPANKSAEDVAASTWSNQRVEVDGTSRGFVKNSSTALMVPGRSHPLGNVRSDS